MEINYNIATIPQISAKEVCFWEQFGDNPGELALACEQGAYPPRIVLEVDGRDATRNAVAELNFKGANEDLKTQIYLQSPPSGNGNHTFMII